jgi:hypothetical protein
MLESGSSLNDSLRYVCIARLSQVSTIDSGDVRKHAQLQVRNPTGVSHGVIGHVQSHPTSSRTPLSFHRPRHPCFFDCAPPSIEAGGGAVEKEDKKIRVPIPNEPRSNNGSKAQAH